MVSEGCAGLLPEHFGTSLLGVAWRLILQWFKTGVFFDDEMLQRELKKQNLTVEFSQISEWERLADPATAYNCRHRTKEIIDLYQRRQIAKSVDLTLEETFDLSTPVHAIKMRIEQDLQQISRVSEPAPDADLTTEDVAVLLDDVRDFILRFIVLSPAQVIIIAVFVAYTYLWQSFETASYLHVTSPEKQCGKTRMMECLSLVTNNPWLTMKTSAAALVRKLHSDKPTLLLDETDPAFGGDKDYAEALRQVLNAGHRKGGKASLCTGNGSDIKVSEFEVFGPKVLAGIGHLPDTVADRSIVIKLARKTPHERVDPFRWRLVAKEAATIRERLKRLSCWVNQKLKDQPYLEFPNLPETLTDRQQDVSEPLLTIADLAGPEWGMAARAALVELFGTTAAEDASIGVRLLTDIRAAFDAAGTDRFRSKDLAAALNAMENSPWAEISRGREITTNTLAKRLEPYGISPKSVRIPGGGIPRGYQRSQFEEVFQRYIAVSGP
jgi:hypothetical protein